MTDILEFFYIMVSNRVKTRIKETTPHKSYFEIYSNDPKQISWIVNNKRGKNNRFLITDAVLFNEKNEEGIVPSLNFENRQEVLWGTKEERISYLYKLFLLVIDEIFDENNNYDIDKELLLCDYVPYAKNRTYWNILFLSDNKFPAIYYSVFEDEIIGNYDNLELEAINWLYNKCKKEFEKIFIDFTNTTDSFSKIDKIFKLNFIESMFIPMLIKHYPDDSSLGLRVKNLIVNDLSKCASMIFEQEKYYNEYSKRLIRASSEYILELEKIQKKYYFI